MKCIEQKESQALYHRKNSRSVSQLMSFKIVSKQHFILCPN